MKRISSFDCGYTVQLHLAEGEDGKGRKRVLHYLSSGSVPTIQIKYCRSENLSAPGWNQSILSMLVVCLLMLSANFSQSVALLSVRYLAEIIKIPCCKPWKNPECSVI